MDKKNEHLFSSRHKKFRSDSWWKLVELNSQQNMKKEFINYFCPWFFPVYFHGITMLLSRIITNLSY